MAILPAPKEAKEKLLKDATRLELDERKVALDKIEREAARPAWDKLEEQMREAADFVERQIMAEQEPLARFGYGVGYVLESKSVGKRIYKAHKFVPLDGTGERGYQKRGFLEPTVADFAEPFNWPGEKIVAEAEAIADGALVSR